MPLFGSDVNSALPCTKAMLLTEVGTEIAQRLGAELQQLCTEIMQCMYLPRSPAKAQFIALEVLRYFVQWSGNTTICSSPFRHPC